MDCHAFVFIRAKRNYGQLRGWENSLLSTRLSLGEGWKCLMTKIICALAWRGFIFSWWTRSLSKVCHQSDQSKQPENARASYAMTLLSSLMKFLKEKKKEDSRLTFTLSKPCSDRRTISGFSRWRVFYGVRVSDKRRSHICMSNASCYFFRKTRRRIHRLPCSREKNHKLIGEVSELMGSLVLTRQAV